MVPCISRDLGLRGVDVLVELHTVWELSGVVLLCDETHGQVPLKCKRVHRRSRCCPKSRICLIGGRNDSSKSTGCLFPVETCDSAVMFFSLSV